MGDLPILPFEKILSYLSLEDRIRSRAVSRYWRDCIDSLGAKSLCCSRRPSGFIYGKSRWVCDTFAQNFIGSPKIDSLLDTFITSNFSNLKRLRLVELKLIPERIPAFAQTIESFDQLEELAIVRVNHPLVRTNLRMELELNLPMLNSIHLELVEGIEKLTLEAPRLRNVKLWLCSKSLRLKIVGGESVRSLLAELVTQTELEKLRNLEHLSVGSSRIDSTLLCTLKQLKEIHLTHNPDDARELLKQKQKLDMDLKVYLRGLLLDGPEDPLIRELGELGERCLLCLADNPSRLADQIPFCGSLDYSDIKRFVPGLSFLDRLIDLSSIVVDVRIRDVNNFLGLLKNCFGHIVELEFQCAQPQALFDQLPDHCAVQKLIINKKPSNFHFLFGLEHLIELYLGFSIDADSIKKALKGLRFLSWFGFKYNQETVTIVIEHSKPFKVSVGKEKTSVSDVNSVIQFVEEKSGGRASGNLFEWIRMLPSRIPTSWF